METIQQRILITLYGNSLAFVCEQQSACMHQSAILCGSIKASDAAIHFFCTPVYILFMPDRVTNDKVGVCNAHTIQMQFAVFLLPFLFNSKYVQ